MRKEYGNKMMLISLIYQFALAWVAAFIVSIIGNEVISVSSGSLVDLLIGAVIVLLAIFILYKMLRKKSSGCSSCSSCSSCPSSSNCNSMEDTQIKEQSVQKTV